MSVRALSPHANYSIQVIEGEEQIVVDGRGAAKSIVIKKPVLADFEKQGLQDHEIEAALEFFDFSGLPEGVHPLTRVGVFDPESYVQRFPADQRGELLATIVDRLFELSEVFPTQFRMVGRPRALRPWPTYDMQTPDEILGLQEVLGIDPEEIRLYELENQARPEIIEAMLRKDDPEAATQQFGPVGEDEIAVQA